MPRLEKVTPLAVKGELAGNLHTAHTDRMLAGRVQQLWLRHSRTKHSHCWPNPAVAPTAAITAATTSSADNSYAFKMLDGTEDPSWEWPWLCQSGYDRIQMRATFAVNGPASSIGVQLQTATLVDTVATASGSVYRVGDPVPVSSWAWRVDGKPWMLYPVLMSVTPTLPATRRVALKMLARLLAVDGEPWTPSWQVDVKLYSIAVRDIRGDYAAF